MSIDAKMVAELRQRTGLPLMKCKQALVDAAGDIEKAAENLRKEGVKASEKVAHRELKDGLVFQKSGPKGACAVALLCQTDFVARSADFVAFGEALVNRLYEAAPAPTGSGDSLGGFQVAEGQSVTDALQGLALKIRENIQVGDYACFKPDHGHVSLYFHHNGRIAALVELDGEGLGNHDAAMELGNDLGMQISFHKDVKALTRDELDAEWVAKEREIFVAQAAEMPADKRDKIAEGKLNKRLQDVVLLEQPFIKNDKETVRKHVEAVAKQVGTPISIKRFARIAAGA